VKADFRKRIFLTFAKNYKLVRITQQNDWVVFILVGCIFLYIFMLLSLQRDSSVKEFLLQKFADASNNFLSWLIISFVFALVFSTFVSQYIPIVPKKISDIQVVGFELNKFGFTFITVLGFYFIKNILSYLFYAGTGTVKKWEIFYFTASKFYFVFSVVLMIFCLINYFYNIDKIIAFDFFAGVILLFFVFKQMFYIFNKNNILPQKWYYKFLYICTLQIIPVLVLWKVLFF